MTGIRIVPSGAPLYVGAIPPGIQVSQSGAAASPLLTGLVSYWKLDETSGTRFDSAGTNNLTDNGGVGSTIGKQGNAALFSGSNDLALPSSTDLRLDNTDFTVSFWVNFDTLPAGDFISILGKHDTTSSREYWFYRHSATNKISFLLSTDGSSTDFINTVGPTLNTGQWYFVVGERNNATNTATLYIHDGITWDNGSITSNGVWAGTSLFGISRPGGFHRLAGSVDEVGIWERLLTPAERTQLYNGGAGITYPFT
jgi:hypothetical protein